METLFLPIIILLKTIFMAYHSMFGGFAVSLLLLSATTSFFIIPLERWGVGVTRKEKALQHILAPQIARIKSESTGKVRHDRITSLYRRYAYHPIYALQSACGLLIQLPLLFSAYYMIKNLAVIEGVPLLPFINDLSRPDHILWGINLLPLVMTAINIAALFSTPGFTRKDTVQGLVVAGLFLILLYNSPSALLLYWTANNFFSFLKNVVNNEVEKSGHRIPRKVTLPITGFVVMFVVLCVLRYLLFAPLPNVKPVKTENDSDREFYCERIKLGCDLKYSFYKSNSPFLYACPVVSNLVFCEGEGVRLPDDEWGEFSVSVAPTPPDIRLTLKLFLGDSEMKLGDTSLTVRDGMSGYSQTYTNWPKMIELGGLVPDENNLLRIQLLCKQCSEQLIISSMLLCTNYSQVQLEEWFNTALAMDTDYVWRDAVSFANRDVKQLFVLNKTMVIESMGPDPYLVFRRIKLPKAKNYIVHIQIKVQQPTRFQFFYQTEEMVGFDEEKSIWQDVWPGENSLYFLLPETFSGDFRIDPGVLEGEQVYEIERVEFRCVNIIQEGKTAI